MKTIIIKMFFVIFLLTNLSQSQDWIKDYPGIPIEAGLHKDWLTWNSTQVRLMKSAGVDFVRMGITDQWVIDSLKDIGLKLLSVEAFNNNWVQYYTDAKYSVWEADAPSGQGDAKLFHNSSKCSVVNNSYLRLNNSAANDTCKMIWGPYYVQDINYYTKSLNGTYDPVFYTADFQIKLESIGPDTAYTKTPICVIQVLHSTASTTSTLSCTDTISEKILDREDFTNLNQFEFYSLDNYNLQQNDCDKSTPSEFIQPLNSFGSSFETQSANVPKVSGRQYVEYRVIWLGHPSYVLSVDSIIVSDQRGRELMNQSSQAQDRIEDQAIAYNSASFTDSVYGWLGFDEPASIDLYEPIKIVRNILDNASTPAQRRSLWLPWRAFWDGAYESRNNQFGAMKLIPWEEFGKRVGRVNVIQNSYLFDLPCNDSNNNLTPCQGDWRDVNIWRHATLMYKPAYELDSFFGVSIQCGEVDPPYPNSYQRDIRSHEFLYTANLALMHGAKFLSLYTYFAQEPYLAHTIFTYRAIVEFANYPITNAVLTDKYFMLKNTLSPRLKGLFGKTLKKLKPTEQYLNHTLSSSEGFIQSIIKGGCTVQGMQPSDEAYDLGFFKDDLDQDYFMLISRWYNSGCNPALTINIKPEYFPDNYNLKVVNLINNATINTITKYGYIYAAPEVGDACFFSVAPVVKFGGLLAYNDTIKTNTTLSDNMTIDAGKVLQINEGKTYTITDTITFTDTSSFITGYGYVNRTQSGWITTRSWNRSLFKGRSGSHPKLIWSKHPDITNVIDYKIYRNHSNGGWQYLTTKSSNIFEYIDSTITIIEGMPQANETSTQYRVTATYRPSKLVIETSPTNTILYHRVEGQGLEKQNSGLTSNDFTFNLDQNYPNPFNPSTTISYSIAEDGIVNLEILNILGERIKTLVHDFKTRGNHNISFNASSLASGVYVYKLQAGDFVSSRKMILLK